jgi:hypothetical protein
MRLLAIYLLLLVSLTESVTTQETLYPRFTTYHSETLKIFFDYPAHWNLDDEDPEILTISPSQNEWLEIGIAEPPHPWVVITKDARWPCFIPKGKPPLFEVRGRENPHKEAFYCLGDVSVLLGFWEKDPDKLFQKKLLERILRSLRRYE